MLFVFLFFALRNFVIYSLYFFILYYLLVTCVTALQYNAELLHPESMPGKRVVFLCKQGPCNTRVSAALLHNFKLIIRGKCDLFYESYFEGGEEQMFFYFMPDSTEDTGA
jgi:hypothetical protein